MMTESNNERQKPATQNQWGEQPSDNYGYASDEERRAKRGLEDWEMVEQMSETESSLKTWGISVLMTFIVGIVVFVLLAFGLYYFLFHYGDLFFTPHTGS